MHQPVEPLTAERIGRALKAMGLKVLVSQDEDGEFLVLFKKDLSAGPMALVNVALQGSANQVLAITALVKGHPPMEPAELLARANEWNTTKRWPRAFVKGGELLVDYHLDLEEGVTEAQLRNFLTTAFSGIGQFLLWMEEGDGLEGLLRILDLAE
ncbi:MAG: YbjN domain-containing protein [Thermus sp.]